MTSRARRARHACLVCVCSAALLLSHHTGTPSRQSVTVASAKGSSCPRRDCPRPPPTRSRLGAA
eukprot:3055112-Prymnesium_polylepis.1